MKILNKQTYQGQKKPTRASGGGATPSFDASNHLNNKKSNSRSSSSSSMNLLNALLKQVNTTKFSPCHACPSLASNIIDRYFSASLRQRKTQNRDSNSRNNLDLIGAATNASLLYQNSPTSSLISINGANILNSGNNQAFMSPSPSPPPFSFQGI